jgi:hypothetical protein
MNLAFEARRVYVAPRKSVLFFAVIGEQRLRYYVHETVLLEGRDSARDETEAYKDCLSAYDRDKDLIQAVARRLIETNDLELDSAIIVSSVARTLEEPTQAPSSI